MEGIFSPLPTAGLTAFRRRPLPLIRYQIQGDEREGRIHRTLDASEKRSSSSSSSSATTTICCRCSRRRVFEAIAASLCVNPAGIGNASLHPKSLLDVIPVQRRGWYDEFFAFQMDQSMKAYETQMAGYKNQLFKTVSGKAQDVLEIGIGTGPNIKYYANIPQIKLTGLDPNQSMEKYALAAASAVGLQDSQFKFVQGVGEALPFETSSFDAVVCTLVLCSVLDMAATLKEVKRVLRPGGSFLFIEHVAAPVGSQLRIWQELLDPVQQFVADGCHLTRDTLSTIEAADFTYLNAKRFDVPNLSLLSPHIIGIAQV